MSNKDDKITKLEVEILAARETIKILQETVKELSKNRVVSVPYPYYVYPYRITWGDQWTVTSNGQTWISTVKPSQTTSNTWTIQLNKGDDDDGSGRVAV